MTNQPKRIDNTLRFATIEAIRRAQNKIQWKSGKDVQHLTKRIRLGHLPAGATFPEYEFIITTVLNNNEAELYIFFYEDIPYPTLVAMIEDRDWLVMIGMDSVIETAFPPDDSESYLADSAFVYIGISGEL